MFKVQSSKFKNNGFTLVELLVVVAIIGILAAVLLVGINPLEQVNKAKDSGKLSKCKEVISAAERYYAFFNTDPANCAALVTAQELKSGTCDGLPSDCLTKTGNVYQCSFVPLSKTFKTKCTPVLCTVPDHFK